jgi:DNA repair protein RadD
VFNRIFARRLAQGRHPLEFEETQQALRLQGLLPIPDFVVARKVQRHYRVQDRIFDYDGHYRRANALR